MRTLLIAPTLALLALTACDEQKAPEAPKKTTTAPETKPGDQAQKTVPPGAPATPVVGSGIATSNTAASAEAIQAYKGRTYTAGPVSLQLNADNTFQLIQTDGNQKVEGRYSYQDSLLILSDPKGDVGAAQFPMRCRFQESGPNAFQLGETAGSCTRFKDLTFKSAAG